MAFMELSLEIVDKDGAFKKDNRLGELIKPDYFFYEYMIHLISYMGHFRGRKWPYFDNLSITNAIE